MARSVPEWIGKDDDAVPPRSVRARVFRAYDGRCYLTKQKIGVADAWDLEHIRPLSMARPGENLNRESNLAPALKAAHKAKSAREAMASKWWTWSSWSSAWTAPRPRATASR